MKMKRVQRAYKSICIQLSVYTHTALNRVIHGLKMA